MMGTVIAINGKISSGKDTFAQTLKENLERKGHEVYIVHFSDALKDAVKYIFELTRYDLHDPLGKQARYRYNPKVTHRDILQIFGTDVCRKLDKFIWVRKTLNIIDDIFFSKPTAIVLIPDLRLYSEYLALKKRYHTFFIRLEREGYDPPNQDHISEWDLDPYPPLHYPWNLYHVLKWILRFANRKFKKRSIEWSYVFRHRALTTLEDKAAFLAKAIDTEEVNIYEEKT